MPFVDFNAREFLGLAARPLHPDLVNRFRTAQSEVKPLRSLSDKTFAGMKCLDEGRV